MAQRDMIPCVDDEDDEWQPPSEAEMKILQAKRERQDKISKIMGDYLLKGYTMLGSMCRECDTILLRTKEGRDYCISCSELDSDISKDDPAMNREAARRQVQEQEQRNQSTRISTRHEDFEDVPELCDLTNVPKVRDADSTRQQRESQRLATFGVNPSPRNVSTDGAGPFISDVSRAPQVGQCDAPAGTDVSDSIGAVYAKLRWATSELQHSCGLENSINLCQLIKSSADAIEALRKIESKPAI